LNLPLVYGAVHRFSGQVSVFDPRDPASPCYRCLFPQPPDASDAPNCSEAGVLGVLPGIIGLLQATEAIKLLLGIGQPLIGRLLCQDALTARFHELGLPRDPQCPGCGPAAAAGPLTDLEQLCSAVRVRDP
jgi:molybdopterin/thiamine biosynthesis adenylyltransferase